jgi:hypothetical protein
MPVCSPGVTAIRVSTTGEASLPAMTMATACAKCTSTRWKVFGLSCGVGCARIGVFPKRNSRSTWDSSSSCTTSASEAKRCFLRSLSSWSRKTLESNKSDSWKGILHVGKPLEALVVADNSQLTLSGERLSELIQVSYEDRDPTTGSITKREATLQEASAIPTSKTILQIVLSSLPFVSVVLFLLWLIVRTHRGKGTAAPAAGGGATTHP